MQYPQELPRISPEGAGIPSDAVIRFLDRLAEKGLPMHSVLMLRHGKLAVEAYYKPFDAARRHRLYSTSKSFVAVAVGILIGEGKLKLDDRVADYFPDKVPADLHPWVAQATVRDLLMMSTPYGGLDYATRADWAEAFFQTPPSHLPGKIFTYDTAATVLLNILVARISGREFPEYLSSRLFAPAGMDPDIACIETPCGHAWGGSGILCTPRDLARFALVCMNGGRWEGQQLIPEDYIREATSRRIDNSVSSTEAEHSFGYGYQFWRTRNNGFACRGMGSQLAVCLPDWDFVLVTTADTQAVAVGDTVIYGALWEEILPHLKKNESLPEYPAALARLQDQISGLSVPAVPGEWTSPAAAEVSGKTYVLDENPMKIKTLRFIFEGDGGTLEYENATGAHSLRFGFGHQVRQPFPETHYNGRRIGAPAGRGYDSLASAAWTLPGSLLLYVYSIDEHVGTVKMNFVFDGDGVTVLMHKYAEWFFNEYEGFASGAAQA